MDLKNYTSLYQIPLKKALQSFWYSDVSFPKYDLNTIFFQRKTEFRKLCDKLRNHLELVLKQTPSPVTINLNNSDTQQMNLDTRYFKF